MDSLIFLTLHKIDPFSQCEKPKQKWRTQNGSSKNDDNVVDDNDHGEEWIKNLLYIEKYGVNLENGE